MIIAYYVHLLSFVISMKKTILYRNLVYIVCYEKFQKNNIIPKSAKCMNIHNKSYKIVKKIRGIMIDLLVIAYYSNRSVTLLKICR